MSIILDSLPTPEEFFRNYWNKKPFVVRGMIPSTVIRSLIDEDHLAGLAMEEEIKSRLVRKGEKQFEWTCHHGPFEEEDFADLGEKDWSLLVQNVDLYHRATAELLKHFNFSPRWLLDDIMTSFSPKGGTVGAHTDSYHVFLVQGKGERCWKVAHTPLKKEEYIEEISLKILKDDFEGEDITVTEGDVIYIPPKFAHQGVSLAPSMTYSVGFLGPSLSEMLIDFGQYLEEHNSDISRYMGQNLSGTAAPFQVAPDHIDDLKSFMTDVFDQDDFVQWLLHYFCAPVQTEDEYPDDEFDDDRDESQADFAKSIIENKSRVIKDPSVKIMFTPSKQPHRYCVSIGVVSFDLDFSDLTLIDSMAKEEPFTGEVFAGHVDILQRLLTRNILYRVNQ
ncbi:cupin domain-containing protein [Temperatibacter marinus]|uniref:Cupin domain-containing protein n=1 Tax=Temperatibacter marinus TaxID=1456591 RepID=A0AA52HBR1_9PROT|nr:cupin domain-containing protein [Temperatibacter marinus]WND03908.1 cupin domain-containing protein [Temperatibacter marinus]